MTLRNTLASSEPIFDVEAYGIFNIGYYLLVCFALTITTL